MLCDNLDQRDFTCKILQNRSQIPTAECIFAPLLKPQVEVSRQPLILKYNTPDIALSFDVNTRKVIINGETCPELTVIQALLLRKLMSNIGVALTREELYYAYNPGRTYIKADRGAINMHINRLKARLAINPEISLIQPILGIGYMIPLPSDNYSQNY